MKTISVTVILLHLLSGCSTAPKADLSTNKGKISYVLGRNEGARALYNHMEVDPDAYLLGFRDGLVKGPRRFTEDEEAAAMATLKESQDEAKKKVALDHRPAVLAFLEKNKSQPGFKASPSGLQYKIESRGHGHSPRKSDKVTVHYVGTLIDGTEFDNTRKEGSPATFQIGSVIPGWQEALIMMKPGARWKIVLPPELGYGDKGRPPYIQPGAALIFDMELLKVN